MSDTTIKGLATLLRNGGNSYQDCRMFLLKPEEAKAYADLLDPPPRFTEAQMAFWKWWRKQGADYVYGEVFPAQHSERERRYLVFVQRKPYQEIGRVEGKMHEWIETCETLDLAELLGKDGESK